MRQDLQRSAAVIVATGVAVAVLACRPDVPPRSADTNAIAAGPLADSAQGGTAMGTLATRAEAQEQFERARAAVAKGDRKAASSALRTAATMFRGFADSATATARERVSASAQELETLAGEVERDVRMSAARLDRTFARANGAEASRHHARALSAWAAHDTVRTGEELLIATDHLERTMRDAAMPSDAGAQRDLAQARTLGNDLLRLRAPASPATDSGLAKVGARIARVTTSLSRGER